MERSGILAELLDQHAEIRRLCAQVRSSAARVNDGVGGDDLLLHVARLQRLVGTHNDHENELLDMVLPSVDAWGVERARRMHEHHMSEHAEALAALVGTAYPADPRLVIEMVDRLDGELAREEEEFLMPSILGDEEVYDLTTTFGG